LTRRFACTLPPLAIGLATFAATVALILTPSGTGIA
jgi:hypothetical protein